MISDVREERNKYKEDSLAYQALSCFFGHPRYVGTSGDNLREIDLNQQNDYAMFARAVIEDYQNKFQKIPFTQQEEFRRFYLLGFDLLKKGLKSEHW